MSKAKRSGPHPLEATVLGLFECRESLSVPELAVLLGAEPGSPPDNAYWTVAADVADRLAVEGKLFRGCDDHYRLGRVGSLAWMSEARDGCRAGLIGLRVRRDDGRVGEIAATVWNKHSAMEVRIEGMTEYEPATRFRLLDRWPVYCCRPSKAKLAGGSR